MQAAAAKGLHFSEFAKRLTGFKSFYNRTQSTIEMFALSPNHVGIQLGVIPVSFRKGSFSRMGSYPMVWVRMGQNETRVGFVDRISEMEMVEQNLEGKGRGIDMI